MTLPAFPLPRDKVDLAGEQVEVRGLSAYEVGQLAGFTGDRAGAEVFVLACGTEMSEADAKLWLRTVPPEAAAPIIDRICELSGLAEGAQKSG